MARRRARSDEPLRGDGPEAGSKRILDAPPRRLLEREAKCFDFFAAFDLVERMRPEAALISHDVPRHRSPRRRDGWRSPGLTRLGLAAVPGSRACTMEARETPVPLDVESFVLRRTELREGQRAILGIDFIGRTIADRSAGPARAGFSKRRSSSSCSDCSEVTPSSGATLFRFKSTCSCS